MDQGRSAAVHFSKCLLITLAAYTAGTILVGGCRPERAYSQVTEQGFGYDHVADMPLANPSKPTTRPVVAAAKETIQETGSAAYRRAYKAYSSEKRTMIIVIGNNNCSACVRLKADIVNANLPPDSLFVHLNLTRDATHARPMLGVARAVPVINVYYWAENGEPQVDQHVGGMSKKSFEDWLSNPKFRRRKSSN